MRPSGQPKALTDLLKALFPGTHRRRACCQIPVLQYINRADRSHTFSAFWLWSSVVSVLISVTADITPTGVFACHIYFSVGVCVLELAQGPPRVARASHSAGSSAPFWVTSCYTNIPAPIQFCCHWFYQISSVRINFIRCSQFASILFFLVRIVFLSSHRFSQFASFFLDFGASAWECIQQAMETISSS